MLAPTLAPGAPHIVIYHLVVDGAARAGVEGGHDVELSPGDIVVFPHGDPHHLSGGTGGNPIESAAILRKIATRDLSPMQAGGGGATTRFVCGYLTCDPLLCGPILESLPPMLKVNVRTDRSGLWLEQSILHLVEEAATASGRKAFLPPRALCTDNGAMIAAAAWWRLQSDGPTPLSSGADPNLRLPES